MMLKATLKLFLVRSLIYTISKINLFHVLHERSLLYLIFNAFHIKK